jgi:hypothetical protein
MCKTWKTWERSDREEEEEDEDLHPMSRDDCTREFCFFHCEVEGNHVSLKGRKSCNNNEITPPSPVMPFMLAIFNTKENANFGLGDLDFCFELGFLQCFKATPSSSPKKRGFHQHDIYWLYLNRELLNLDLETLIFLSWVGIFVMFGSNPIQFYFVLEVISFHHDI